MPPRKKATSGSKKNQNLQQSQPSKFGIQHFFERHTQNALSQSPKIAQSSPSSNSNTAIPIPQNPPNVLNSKRSNANNSVPTAENPTNAMNSEKTDPNPANAFQAPGNPNNEAISHMFDSRDFDLDVRNSRNALNLGIRQHTEASAPHDFENGVNLQKSETINPARKTLAENSIPDFVDEINQLEVSPEICKSVSFKRFKFSPGMLIKQSQDDGGDEVTWRISPVNERLQAMSKNLPEMMRVLADSTRFNSLNFHHSSQKKTSTGSAGKLEKWPSSPPLNTAEKSLIFSSRVSLKNVTADCKVDLHGSNGNTKNSGAVSNGHSPFKTPPSLSCGHDKPTDCIDPNGVSRQLCSRQHKRQHKKALLELLDQVEDVISVEESTCEDTGSCLSKLHDIVDDEGTVNAVANELVIEPTENVDIESSYLYFLVLEVSEKRGSASGSQCPVKVLRLLNEKSGEEHVVYLWDEWFYSVIAPGDTVHVIGEFDGHRKCDVNREKNFLIVHPDILMSGTRVASSFSCPRRTVLDERLKCSEYSASALIGTLLHQIFQAGLIKEIPTKEFLEEYARVVLQKNIESIYACGVNESDTYKTIIEAIPRLLSWIHLFRDSKDQEIPPVDFGSGEGQKKVTISEVVDIEEIAWAPKYGLKGIIDASLRVKVESNTNQIVEKIMPLEFKTGKSTTGQTATEHSAQVMLYTLLMSERYLKNIDSGLLYYLHTDQTQGITVRRSDLIGLIMRRNELASDILKASMTQQLPPMSQSPSMCKGCRHLNVCTIYHKVHGGSTEASGLSDMFNSLVRHLTTAHCIFLQKWDRLIDLEAKELEVVKREIWCSRSLGENSASCLSSIVLDTSDSSSPKSFSKGNRYVYCFVLKNLPVNGDNGHKEGSLSSLSHPINNLDCTLKEGDYVILSTEPARLMVASGIIMDISYSHVLVSFSKRLRLPSISSSSVANDLGQMVWRIDKDEAMASFAIMRYNLIQLFLQNDRSSHLRKMIVDLEAPQFDSGCIFSQDPAISYIWSEKNLNDDQRRAIFKILTAKDYALILGMPGTGKTSTMVHAVKALLMRGASILLTSYTNSAVDNLLIKLKAQGIDFIRIGRCEAVKEEVRGHCFSGTDMNGSEELKLRLDQIKVVAVTCLGITNPLLAKKRFDICIMDEAGQTTLPVSLGALMFASVFVLVGDHYQLPPLVQSAEARENGMGVSLFCRLSEAHPQAISSLQSQYRMCAAIMELSNALIYGNRLRCGSPEIENAKLKYTNMAFLSSWLKEVLNPNKPVIFINTDLLPALETRDRKTVNNPIEAHIIAEAANELIVKGIKGDNIGIITPYNSQANLIHQAVSTPMEIHTIDKYQGRDKDCILVSFVRSTEKPRRACSSSLLGDWHRINVAITRAKKKLIMVGSCKTLSKVPVLKLLIDKVEEQSGIVCVSNNDISHKRELKRCSQKR